MQDNALYIGHVYHKRHQPFTHQFKYRVFTLWLDIDALPALAKRLKFFSFNRWNVTAIRNKDHARRDGSDIRPWIEEAAKDKGIDLQGGRIFMLTFPRLWGFVFNPLTIFYCYDRDSVLRGILHQVKNTFGEQHGYFLPVEEVKDDLIRQSCDKVFHVSPFIQMDCRYDFVLKEPDEKLDAAIHQFQPDGKILTATWTGRRQALTDWNVFKAVCMHPLMTLKVIAAIHWEALLLWGKGAKYISKPEPPARDVS